MKATRFVVRRKSDGKFINKPAGWLPIWEGDLNGARFYKTAGHAKASFYPWKEHQHELEIVTVSCTLEEGGAK